MAYPSFTQPPTPPSTNDSAALFRSNAFSFLAWMQEIGGQLASFASGVALTSAVKFDMALRSLNVAMSATENSQVAGIAPLLNVIAVGTETPGLSVQAFGGSINPPSLLLARSRSASPSVRSAVVLGDIIGETVFVGDNGGALTAGAKIRAVTETTWTTAATPTNVEVCVCPSASLSPIPTWKFSYDKSLSPSVDNVSSLGTALRRVTTVYASTATINTSDERCKTQIGSISESILDAWDEVKWTQFKFLDSVKEKGDSARWHFGLVAQQVAEAFTKHGIDPLALGLVCHDVWAESVIVDQPAEVDVDGAVVKEEIRRIIPAGDRYGLRYDYAFSIAMAAAVRKQIRFEARLKALEDKLV